MNKLKGANHQMDLYHHYQSLKNLPKWPTTVLLPVATSSSLQHQQHKITQQYSLQHTFQIVLSGRKIKEEKGYMLLPLTIKLQESKATHFFFFFTILVLSHCNAITLI